MKMGRKVLSLVLSFSMVMQLIPASALASADTETVTTGTSATTYTQTSADEAIPVVIDEAGEDTSETVESAEAEETAETAEAVEPDSTAVEETAEADRAAMETDSEAEISSTLSEDMETSATETQSESDGSNLSGSENGEESETEVGAETLQDDMTNADIAETDACTATEPETEDPTEDSLILAIEELNEEEPAAISEEADDTDDGIALASYDDATVISSSVTLSEDMVYDGDVLIYFDDGAVDTLDLNGYALTIKGNLYQTNGTVSINGGTLTITGDYRMQKKSEDEDGYVSWMVGSGDFYMTNESDHVIVGGDFVQTGYVNLTAGTLEVAGDFIQLNSEQAYEYLYEYLDAEDSHKVILNGSGLQKVYFESSKSRFNILEITQSADNYIFNRLPCWNTLLQNDESLDDTVFGNYAMGIFEDTSGSYYVSITGYIGDDTDITVPSELKGYPVTEIGARAFYDNDTIQTVTLPNGITDIGSEIFAGCTALTTVTLSNSLTSIPSYTFSNCA
ncbi:MAG: leucine-rich repeat protein, partial [Lachnospiraceae bacterium]|nr:leucine-rich repeat protein [Lachnospiraceae bacterium]